MSKDPTQPGTACPRGASSPVREADIPKRFRNALKSDAVISAVEEKRCVRPEQVDVVGQPFAKVSR